jgi:muramoyltetrapeptide carboxypeptidase
MEQTVQQISRRSLGKGFLGGLGVGLSTIWATRSQSHEAIAAPTDLPTKDKDKQASNLPQTIIKPPMLRPGDRVGMIAPASDAYEPEEIQIAKETMELYGFEVLLAQHIGDRYGYLAGQDRDRAADINQMFGREDIRGLVTFSGGYGCSRLLPLLDYELIRQNPKVIVGHSDITALLMGIYAQTGVVTFHGSSGLTGVGEYARSHFRRAIMNKETIGQVAQPPATNAKTVERNHRLVTISPGQATGQLVGGNLTLVTNLVGSPYFPDLKGKILFLEDVGEEPYRIDRMLTQLLLSGQLKDLAGIALGHFSNCYPKEYQASFFNTLSLEEVLRDRLAPLEIPTLYNLMFGHVQENAVLPLGVEATLDATAKTLTINESAVG